MSKTNLLKTWKDNEYKAFSIREIMEINNKNSKPWVFEALNKLDEQNLIKKSKKSNLNLYELNTENILSWSALQKIEDSQNTNFSKLKIINKIISNINTSNYCLIVFGSYADDTATKNSDIDIVILAETEETIKKIKPQINEIKLETIEELDVHYITTKEFIELLLNKEENLGKQILKKHKIFFNENIYFNILKEAHQHGFRN